MKGLKSRSRWMFWLLLTPLLAPFIISIVKNKPAPPPSDKVTIHLSSMSMTGSASPRNLRPYHNLSRLIKQHSGSNIMVVEWQASVNGGGGLQGVLGYNRLRRTLIDHTTRPTRVDHEEWKNVTEAAVHAAGEAETRAMNAAPGNWKVVRDAHHSVVLRRYGARRRRR